MIKMGILFKYKNKKKKLIMFINFSIRLFKIEKNNWIYKLKLNHLKEV